MGKARAVTAASPAPKPKVPSSRAPPVPALASTILYQSPSEVLVEGMGHDDEEIKQKPHSYWKNEHKRVNHFRVIAGNTRAHLGRISLGRGAQKGTTFSRFAIIFCFLFYAGFQEVFWEGF